MIPFEVRSFCEPLVRTKAVSVTAVLYTVVTYTLVLLRSTFGDLRIYNFTQAFRVELAVLGASGSVVTVLLVLGLQTVLERRQQNRIPL